MVITTEEKRRICSLLPHHIHLLKDLCVAPTSEMRTETLMRSGNLFWAKVRQTSDVLIELQPLFEDYWSSNKDEFITK